MHTALLRTLTISGLIMGTATMALASPATPLVARESTVQTAQVERVAYFYNHRRYNHRSWDRRHRRWRYY